MAYLIATIGSITFVVFICFSSMLLNETVKRSQRYRNQRRPWRKVKHSIYTVCYSIVFSSMLIVSVCFPFFLLNTCGNQSIQFKNPLISLRESIINKSEQSLLQPFNNFNIFNEINQTMDRFNNNDFWD